MALRQVDAPEVLSSDRCRALGGPSNTSEWQARMGNWHRNLFVGIENTPEVRMDARLLVVDEEGSAATPGNVSIRWMESVGLDRSVKRRGLAVAPPATADALAGTPGIRVLKPLGPRLRQEESLASSGHLKTKEPA